MALSAEQWTFIGYRLLAKSDTEAADKAGVHVQTVYSWKREDPDFLREYEAAFTDGVHVAKEYTRKLLGKAAQRLDEGLDAIKIVGFEVSYKEENGKRAVQFVKTEVPDHKSRLEAVKLLFTTHGLLVTKTELSGPGGAPIPTTDLSVVAQLSDEDLALYERLCERIKPAASEPGPSQG